LTDQAKKKKQIQIPQPPEQKIEIKDLSGQIPPSEDILSKIDNAQKQEVTKPKKQTGDCCIELMNDCCMDD
jgi:hypothetical protein